MDAVDAEVGPLVEEDVGDLPVLQVRIEGDDPAEPQEEVEP